MAKTKKRIIQQPLVSTQEGETGMVLGKAHREERVMNSSVKKNTFIFCAPIINVAHSNGILSVISLAKELEAQGCDVYFFCIVTEYPFPEELLTLELEERLDKAFWIKYREQVTSTAAALGIKLLIDKNDPRLQNAFVVYPERIISNPLDALNVIRYFGNKNGALNGGRLVDTGQRDFILSHSKILHPAPHFVLFFAHVNPLFNDQVATPFENRTKSLTYVGKGDMYGGVSLIEGTELLTRTYPPTKQELAELLRNTRFLFTWDTWSNIISEAIFCGAIPVILKQVPFSEKEIDESELGPIPRIAVDKLTFSTSTNQFEIIDLEELSSFQRNRRDFIDRVNQYSHDYPNQVKSLLEAVILHFSNFPASSDPAEPLSLLQSTESAFALANKGELPVIELFNAAQRLSDAQQPDIAIQLYRLWLDRTNSPVPYSVYVQHNLAELLAKAGDASGAEETYRAAIAKNPTFIEGNLALVLLLERTNRPDEALAVLRNVLTYVSPEDPAYRGFYQQAMTNMERLQKISRELPQAAAVQARSSGASALPLVSVLIPTHNRPDYLEIALKSVLDQNYENIEIIISDNGDDTQSQERIAPYLKQHPNITYYRKQGMTADENGRKCLELSKGEYINYLMDDDVFHPQKIQRMMDYYLNFPDIGLVTSFRQLIDEHGQHLPPIPGTERLFPNDTVITGQSFGNLMLSNGTNLIGEPTTVLVRRADVGDAFGTFAGRRYTVLSDVATWLSILATRDCVYISDPLSYFRIHSAQDQRGNTIRTKASLEWFGLFFDAHKNQLFLQDRTEFITLLARKIAAFTSYIAANHAEISAENYNLNEIYAVIQKGYQVLLGETADMNADGS